MWDVIFWVGIFLQESVGISKIVLGLESDSNDNDKSNGRSRSLRDDKQEKQLQLQPTAMISDVGQSLYFTEQPYGRVLTVGTGLPDMEALRASFR